MYTFDPNMIRRTNCLNSGRFWAIHTKLMLKMRIVNVIFNIVVPELQGDPYEIAKDKAMMAYKLVMQYVITTSD